MDIKLVPGPCHWHQSDHLCSRQFDNSLISEMHFLHLSFQEPYFQWMFGVKEPAFYGVVQVSTAKALLFMPRLPEEFAVWMGRLHGTDDVKKMYSVDEVHYVDDVSNTVHSPQFCG
jgi:Xaa-Pro aminopeptidase